MINPNTKLNVFHNSTDHSNDAFDFTRDNFDLTLLSTDYLYIGYYKPVHMVYLALESAQNVANSLTIEYWNGSAWESVSNQFDDSKGFTRSGFIQWDKPSAQSTNTVNTISKYWVRIKPSVDQGEVEVKGINIIFADDQDLITEVPEITDVNHLAGKTSHILTHVAVRNQIIQDLNNKDYKKTNPSTGLNEDLTCWDVLDANQLKQAAMFLALAKIYFNFSDNPEDKYYQKYQDYMARYRDAYNLSSLYLDSNDDGVLNPTEQQSEGFSIIRIKR